MIPGKKYTPELLFAAAWRRKWLIVVPTLVIGVLTCAVTYLLPNQYRSETTVLVVPQRIPENLIRSTVATRVEDRLRSINQQVRSRTRLEQIIEEFNLYEKRRKTDIMQDIVEDMGDKIDVQFVQGDVFRVSFISDDPQTTMKVTEKLATFFINESVKDRAGLAEDQSDFLQTTLADAGQKLQALEQKLADYRRQHDGELPSQLDANMQGQNATQMQLQAVRQALASDRERQLTLQRSVADLVQTLENIPAETVVTQNPDAPKSVAEELQVAKALLAAMLTQKQPDHPDVRTLRSQIAELEAKLGPDAKGTAAPMAQITANPAAVRVQRNLDAARADLERADRAVEANLAEQKRLNAILADYQHRMAVTPIRDAELVQLMRDYTTWKQSYESLSAKQIDSKISADVERRQFGEQFRVLDHARIPEKPFSPNRPRFYLLGVLLAIAVGFGCAALAEYFDRGMRSEDDVRLALALPVLATIPVIGQRKPEKPRKLFARFAAGFAILAAAAGAFWFTRG